MGNEPATPGPVRSKRPALSRLACLFVSVLLALTVVALTPEQSFAATWTVNTTNRTEAEIRAQWQAMQPTYSGTPYATTPRWTSPYAAGTLNASFAADGLRMINFGRYLAGLPCDVTIDPSRATMAQHGAVLMAADGTIGHDADTLPKPSGMTTDFYNTALSSVGSSNVGRGYSDSESFQRGCLADANSGNLATVGHRRWLLNPAMKVTAVGFANNYHTTYAFDRSRSDTVSYSAITWPSAGYFPVEFFSAATPWSITLNPARYDWNTSGQTVTLKRVSDGKTWTFNAQDTLATPIATSEFFSANFTGYGVANAFIFRPVCSETNSISYSPGDVFEVKLSGGIYLEGTTTPATITYRTTFMSLDGPVFDPGMPDNGVIEDYSAGVTFDRFVACTSSAYSGGSYVYGRWTGTQLQARFVGTSVAWIGPKQSGYGKADVYVDGAKVATVDCYAAAAQPTLSTTIWETSNLKDGSHTIAIRLVGQKNPSSSGYVVVVDAFDTGTIGTAVTGTRADESAGTFSGSWVTSASSAYYGYGYRYSRWAGAKVRYTFTGTRIAWIGPRATSYGKAAIYVDGVYRATVSQYGALGWRYRVWESGTLSRGTHTIEIRVLGTKEAASSGTTIVVDGFDVKP